MTKMRKHRAFIRMIKKSKLIGNAYALMSHKDLFQYEYPDEEMAKAIDGREMLDVTDDKFTC